MVWTCLVEVKISCECKGKGRSKQRRLDCATDGIGKKGMKMTADREECRVEPT